MESQSPDLKLATGFALSVRHGVYRGNKTKKPAIPSGTTGVLVALRGSDYLGVMRTLRSSKENPDVTFNSSALNSGTQHS